MIQRKDKVVYTRYRKYFTADQELSLIAHGETNAFVKPKGIRPVKHVTFCSTNFKYVEYNVYAGVDCGVTHRKIEQLINYVLKSIALPKNWSFDDLINRNILVVNEPTDGNWSYSPVTYAPTEGIELFYCLDRCKGEREPIDYLVKNRTSAKIEVVFEDGASEMVKPTNTIFIVLERLPPPS
jgi:hypothetical protein